MRKYETMYIIDPDFDEEATKQLIEKFKGVIEEKGGKIEEVDEWGKRRLAYPVHDRREGYYVLMHFEAAPEAVIDLERVFKITIGVLKYLIVKKDK